MWTCPRCKHKFYNKNQSHSCGHYTVSQFLNGKTSTAVKLFKAFIAQYKKIGTYDLHPVKTRVALLTKMRFASINKLGPAFIDGHFVLTKSHNDPAIFYKIDNLNNRFFVHHFRLYHEEEITPAFKRYMKLAYAIGQREHVKQLGKKEK